MIKISKYERYKKDIIEPRKDGKKKMMSTREMRRRVGRRNMKPKSIQLREIHNTMVKNKVLIESLKRQIILNEQKIQVLQEDMITILEKLDNIEIENKPAEPSEEDKLRKRYGLEMHKRALRGGKETQIYKKWRKKQKIIQEAIE